MKVVIDQLGDHISEVDLWLHSVDFAGLDKGGQHSSMVSAAF